MMIANLIGDLLFYACMTVMIGSIVLGFFGAFRESYFESMRKQPWEY